MTAKAAILIVDDDPSIVAALNILLTHEGYTARGVTCPEQALALAKQTHFDIVLLDMNYRADTTSGEEGLALIRKFNYFLQDIRLIAMTAWSSVDLAVQCLQAGAQDYIEKPWDNKRLLSIIKNQALLNTQRREQEALRSENALLQAELNSQQGPGLVCHSPAMQALLTTVHKVANSDLNIFLTGENGTGKSFLAKYIHQHSARKQARFVALNAGAVHESLFESDMFGHVKGAFTDARENRIGRFELANKGTLFLDEIANLPLTQQAKLLRVLEEQQFEKVGSSITQHTDVRMIAATNADMSQLVASGKFRQDLLYRLNSIEIALPPLRQRQQDIFPLANRHLEASCQRYGKAVPEISQSAMQAMLYYPWPGNIRELQHVIERSLVLCDGTTIDVNDLALSDVQTASQNSPNLSRDHAFYSNAALNDSNTALNHSNAALNDSSADVDYGSATLAQLERHIIEQRIQWHQGNMTQAARSLGLSRSAFYRRLEKLQIK